MKCLVMLGNPGKQYAETRHNAGFLIGEEFCRRYGAKLQRETELGVYFNVQLENTNHGILFPMTYMNLSGEAVREALELWELHSSDILVAYDDVAIPFGQFRFRELGSDGGHNGMGSIIYTLQSDQIHRFRFGIGSTGIPQQPFIERLSEYVLSPFSPTEQNDLQRLIEIASHACHDWILSGTTYCMHTYNKNFLLQEGG